MTCLKPPLDIQTDGSEKCSLKCRLHYKYGDSSCRMANYNVFINIQYDGVSDVVFNNVKYTPNSILLVRPSLHTYSGQPAAAEIMIFHTSNQGGLVISVPLVVGAKLTQGSYLLKDIISAGPKSGDGSASPSIADFNINYLIPKSRYYTYEGPGIGQTSCNSMLFQYVVFHPRYGAISISSETFKVLEALVQPLSFITASRGICAVNMTGTTNNGFDGDGQIYIDCQPTGESEEEVVYKEAGAVSTMPNDTLMTILMIVIGVVIIFATFMIMKFVLGNVSKITNKSNLVEIKK